MICHHSGPHFDGIIPLFTKIGWAGVDLFFVLSGFLISGLLFAEYRKVQSIRIGRFLIRRGFKIYPSFYVFLVVAGIVAAHFSRTAMPGHHSLLHEIFFVQNYLPGEWGHTWSLAVEEHFYVLLPIFLVVLAKRSTNRENPFRSVPIAFVFVAIISLASRALFLLVPQQNPYLGLSFSATNSRMDALFFGVLLSYLYYFNSEPLKQFFLNYRNQLAILCAALLSVPLIVSRETPAFVTFGLTGMYLGFGILLMLSLFVRDVLPSRMRPALSLVASGMAFLGVYSYSIYLWHIPMAFWTPAIGRRIFHVDLPVWVAFVVSFIASLIVGITMARVVEFPMLRIRERFFPTPNKGAHDPIAANLDPDQVLRYQAPGAADK